MEITGSLPRVMAMGRSSPPVLGLAQVLGDVVHRHRLQRELPLALDLDAVDADVLLAAVLRIVGVLGHHRRLVEVEAAVAVVEPDQREHLEDVDVVAVYGCSRAHGGSSRHTGFDREVRPAADELVDLVLDAGVLRQAQGESVVGPRSVHVHRDPRVGESGDVVEIQRGGVIAQPGRGVRGGGDIRFGHHFVGDPQKLSLLVESCQETRAGRRRPSDISSRREKSGNSAGFSRAARMPSQRLASAAGRSNWSRMRATRWSTMSSTDFGWL